MSPAFADLKSRPTRRAVLAAAGATGMAACAIAPSAVLPSLGTLLPFTEDEAGRIFVSLDVEGHGAFAFLIDTGATSSAVFAETALARDLEVSADRRRVWGLGGAAMVPKIAIPPRKAGALTLPAAAGVLLPARRGSAAAGLIGLDVFARRALSVDRLTKTLRIGPLGETPTPGRGWDRLPLANLSTLSGGGSLLFADLDVGDRRFPALIDLGSDSTYFSWTIAEASKGLRRLRRQLFRQVQRRLVGEGAVAAFRPRVEVRVSGLMIARHQFGPVAANLLEVPSEELLGLDQGPVAIAGMNMFRSRNFIVDAARGALYLRTSDRARQPRAFPMHLEMVR